MGVPQWPIVDCDDAYPLFAYKPPRSVQKRLAGNVTRFVGYRARNSDEAMRPSVSGAVHAATLYNKVP